MFTEYLEHTDLLALFAPRGQRLPFPPASDRAAWENVPAAMRQEITEAAQAQRGVFYPPLPATCFLAYVRTGDRKAYETPYFTRRRMLLTAMLAECLLASGEYLDQVIDGLWVICEESFWGISAHNGSSHEGMRPASERPLPDIQNPYIDLFAAQTSALLTWTCYLLRDRLDAVSPLIIRRVRLEAERRIVKPFLHHDDFWWMGMIRKDVNNWTPWILSNVIATLILTKEDDLLLVEGLKRALRMLDSYLAVIPPDGGCDEGAGYWNMAGASLLDCLEHLSHLTGGRVSFYKHPHIRNIAAFPQSAHIAGPYFWNFADCDARPMMDGERVFRFGMLTDQPALAALGASIAARESGILPKDTPETFRVLCKLFRPVPNVKAVPQKGTVILPDLQAWASRRARLYAAVKGGHNGESHNHNDVGTFLLYADGEPEIVDAGNMTYTAKTFGPERYTLWNTRSMNHNVPVIGGVEQRAGREYAAKDVSLGKEGISMELAAAYPKEAMLLSLRRQAGWEGDLFVLTDTLALSSPAPITWVFLLRNRPELSPGLLHTERITLRFDGALIPSLTEIPVTDPRMASNFSGSLFRLCLAAPACTVMAQRFMISRRNPL